MIDGRPFAHYVYLHRGSARAEAWSTTRRRARWPDGSWARRPGCSTTRSSAWHTRTPARRGLGLLPHRVAHRPPVRAASTMWPAVAFTIHFDPTSPANGFLRVLPGSHLGGTDGIPLGFERVPGEIAVYQERGDVLFHHADLWHSAARGTADGSGAVRRHLRGSWTVGPARRWTRHRRLRQGRER